MLTIRLAKHKTENFNSALVFSDIGDRVVYMENLTNADTANKWRSIVNDHGLTLVKTDEFGDVEIREYTGIR